MSDLPRRQSLVHHPNFLKLWVGDTISQFGTQVSQLALPLVAIIFLKASAFEVALLGVIEFMPFLLFTLPAGALFLTDCNRHLVLPRSSAGITVFYEPSPHKRVVVGSTTARRPEGADIAR